MVAISRMRTLWPSLGAALLALAVFTGPAAAALETYNIDASHSSPTFKIRHLFSQVSGRFSDFAGVLQVDPAKPENSHIEITIQAASINTDNQRRDDHLRSADFFNVEKFPVITFKSTKIEPGGAPNRYLVTGDFTLLGVTRPVTVTVDALGFADFPGMGYRGGFAATTTINRKDFGMQWNKLLDAGGTMLGEDVQIDFPIEVVRTP
jgi:polyisoprenoid-binding protein YceI